MAKQAKARKSQKKGLRLRVAPSKAKPRPLSTRLASALKASRPPPAADVPCAPPHARRAARVVTVPSDPTRVTVLSTSPRIVMVDNFLSPGLCQELIGAAKPYMERSLTTLGVSESRTSFSACPHDCAAVRGVGAQLMALVNSPDVRGGRGQLEETGSVHVNWYSPGQEFREHYDNTPYFDPNDGLRDATVLLYLNDVPKGGGTTFRRSCAEGLRGQSKAQLGDLAVQLMDRGAAPRQPGVRVLPVQGRCVVFWSQAEGRASGVQDCNACHAADKVLAGEKYVLCRWYHSIGGGGGGGGGGAGP